MRGGEAFPLQTENTVISWIYSENYNIILISIEDE